MGHHEPGDQEHHERHQEMTAAERERAAFGTDEHRHQQQRCSGCCAHGHRRPNVANAHRQLRGVARPQQIDTDGRSADAKKRCRDRAGEGRDERKYHGNDEPAPMPCPYCNQRARQPHGERHSADHHVDHSGQSEHDATPSCVEAWQGRPHDLREASRRHDRCDDAYRQRTEHPHERWCDQAVVDDRVTGVPVVVPHREARLVPQFSPKILAGVVGPAHAGDEYDERTTHDDEHGNGEVAVCEPTPPSSVGSSHADVRHVCRR